MGGHALIIGGLLLDSRQLGVLNEHLAMSYYSSLGYQIFVPVGADVVDFIAVRDRELLKVQVKTARIRDEIKVLADFCRSRQSGRGVKRYQDGDIDEFFVIGNQRGWRIPFSEELAQRRSVTLNNKHEWEVTISHS